MKQIIAKRVTVIQRQGLRIDYTHVSEILTEMFNADPTLYINGETDDSFGGRRIVHDRHLIKNLELSIIEWRIPPE